MFRMPIIPLIARVLLAAIFILAGVNKILSFAGTTAYIASKGLPVPEAIAALTILLELVGGILLVIGFKTRIVALLIALFCIAAAVIFHPFWTMQGAAGNLHQIMFLKNLAIAGGMFLLVYYGAGPVAIDNDKN